jgi:hypothetical protein
MLHGYEHSVDNLPVFEQSQRRSSNDMKTGMNRYLKKIHTAAAL